MHKTAIHVSAYYKICVRILLYATTRSLFLLPYHAMHKTPTRNKHDYARLKIIADDAPMLHRWGGDPAGCLGKGRWGICGVYALPIVLICIIICKRV